MSHTRRRSAAWTGGAAAATVILMAGSASAVIGTPAADGQYTYTARINIGEGDSTRACSAALVAAQWLLTSAGCFADNPGDPVPAGKPKLRATATLGENAQEVTLLVPRTDRDVVLAKLAQPIAGVAPVKPAAAAPTQGAVVTTAGFGRTKTAWVPGTVHTGAFDTLSVDATTLALKGKGDTGDTICKGDAGGPVLNTSGELVGISSRSWQAGCLGTDPAETRNSAVAVRADGLGDWIQQVLALPGDSQVASGDFNGDGKEDIAAFYDDGVDADGRNRSALHTFFSNGAGFNAPVKTWTSSGAFTWQAGKLVAGDFNGDKKDDVAVFYEGGKTADGKNKSLLFTFTSTGSGFAAPRISWTSGATASFSWSASKVTAGDFNGDGKDDIGVFYNRGVSADGKRLSALFTLTSDGTNFGAPVEKWASTGSFSWDAAKVTAGDFNGDLKDDVAVFYDGGKVDGENKSLLFTFTSTGTGFAAPRNSWTSSSSFSWGASKVTAGDHNGDGKDDIAVLYGRGVSADGKQLSALFTLTSDGSNFGAPVEKWASTGNFSWDAAQQTSGDYNGDGKDDVGTYYDSGVTAEGRQVDTLFSFLTTTAGLQAPGSRWSGSVS
ncbi:FG-GAP-like repeat-containing protein [Streptomyces sp. NBC_00091]|uniref:FG-GAP-like repeat-containing protein n=1 Tax=Streptomyces sp. NBC_00091 TaxID=2975648 RepID=UPI00224EBB16|nr:FG-GAP-like repeat-containing protein [Streptomyces sp. NBC_00091]MCX5374981.1 FG-GAP-like repeat-containing protein [Streptomyces sp. NBC_00091]